MTRRIPRRYAVAMSGCMDISDMDAYQYGRHTERGAAVYNFGDGYAIALNPGEPVPPRLAESFGPWTVRETIGGWTVWEVKL